MKTKKQIEQELRGKLYERLPCFRDIFNAMPCPYDGACGSCGDMEETIDALLTLIKSVCYLKADGELPEPPDNVTKEQRIGFALGMLAISQPDPEGRVWASIYKEW